MRNVSMIAVLFASLVLLATGCAQKSAYFGIPNQALYVPESIPETEKAIDEAAMSPGAAHCPEKIEEARALAKEGVRDYWACYDEKSREKLAEARKLAEEAKECRPPAAPVPPPPQPAPPPPKPVPTPPSARVVLTDVVIEKAFEFDSLRLTPHARAILDRQAEVIKENPDVTVEIYGHTDSVGTESYNRLLSMRRALSAKRYLEEKNIASGRMKTFGLGELFPIASNDTEEGRARNRRVEINYVE